MSDEHLRALEQAMGVRAPARFYARTAYDHLCAAGDHTDARRDHLERALKYLREAVAILEGEIATAQQKEPT